MRIYVRSILRLSLLSLLRQILSDLSERFAFTGVTYCAIVSRPVSNYIHCSMPVLWCYMMGGWVGIRIGMVLQFPQVFNNAKAKKRPEPQMIWVGGLEFELGWHLQT